MAPGKCSPEPRQRSGSGLRLCEERLLSKPGGYCPVSSFGPLLVLLVGLGALSARTLGCRSTGRFTEANHGAGVSGSHRQAPSVQMQLPDSGHRELTSSSQERPSVEEIPRCAGTGKRPREDTGRRRPSASQGERLQEKPNLQAP
ncbi:uncharacterized protein ZNF470-DT [Macaca mulatta]|nr:uncharacterized protein LOC123570331 [Macaca fascicularis]